MLKISPFTGFLFNPGGLRLDKTLCPPYDDIPDRLAENLRLSPLNAIHLELPFPVGKSANYAAAARTWKRWTRQGRLLPRPSPGFYLCEQSFSWRGRRLSRIGFFAALSLDPAGRAALPHEKTLSAPKEDRMRLLKSLGVNTSPILLTFADPGKKTARLLRSLKKSSSLLFSFTDPSGIKGRLWELSSPSSARRLENLFRGKTLLIADGHHRYEVCRRFSRSHPELPGSRQTLAFLFPDSEAAIGSIYRVLRPGPGIMKKIKEACLVKPLSSLGRTLASLEREPDPDSFGTYDGRFWLASPREKSSLLSVEWIARFLCPLSSSLFYTKDWNEAKTWAEKRKAAVLIPKPLKVPEILKAVLKKGALPPKSTYFYPKVPTGLVFRKLDGAGQ